MNFESEAKELRETLAAEAPIYGLELSEDERERLSSYYQLVLTWNARLHLVAPTSPNHFATRHILESLLMLEYLPENAKIADVGSGGGLPIIPCLVVRPDLRAWLVESSKKKTIFLREALNQTASSSQAQLLAERFENIDPPEVDFVSSRALERFEKVFPKLLQWIPTSTLLLFGGEGLAQQIRKSNLVCTTVSIPHSERRFLFVLTRP